MRRSPGVFVSAKKLNAVTSAVSKVEKNVDVYEHEFLCEELARNHAMNSRSGKWRDVGHDELIVTIR